MSNGDASRAAPQERHTGEHLTAVQDALLKLSDEIEPDRVRDLIQDWLYSDAVAALLFRARLDDQRGAVNREECSGRNWGAQQNDAPAPSNAASPELPAAASPGATSTTIAVPTGPLADRCDQHVTSAQYPADAASTLPTCPKCGAEDSMEHHQHRFSTERGPNLSDADWDQCAVCGYQTAPE